MERKPDDDEPFAALAFKIMTDPYVGKLTFFRVYSGTIEAGDTRLNATTGTRSASGASCRCTPTSARRSRRCFAGDIVAASVSRTRRPATRCATEHPIVLESDARSRSR